MLGCDAGLVESETEDIQVYFSPEDRCDEKVAGLINQAVQEVHIAVYSFNRYTIAEAVVEAHRRGVSVRVIVDADQAGNTPRDEYLEGQGVPLLRIDYPGYGAMHHKFAVIDRRIVVTGSYNWTSNATMNNNENMAVLTSRNAAKRYNDEFEKIWGKGM
jgi:phosphatidylserine/phosphatidylglycerophosphate/cardiolipin synthase-like enzyme